MARYTGPSCRLCRREGQKLYLKGDRCYTDKCALTRRAQVPGHHGARRTKLSNYGVQLREKQKVKRYYGLLEGQFRATYDRAEKMHGITGENFLQLLEMRFDNIIYRLGFASSRKEARQLVNLVTLRSMVVKQIFHQWNLKLVMLLLLRQIARILLSLKQW